MIEQFAKKEAARNIVMFQITVGKSDVMGTILKFREALRNSLDDFGVSMDVVFPRMDPV